MFNEINDLSIRAYFGARNSMNNAKCAMKDLFNDEDGISGIVVAVILVLVAVVLLAVFQTELTTLVGNMWRDINKSADGMEGVTGQ